MKKLIVLCLLLCASLYAHAQTSAPLTLSRVILLPGVTGKFDHLAIDEAGHRLFIAATGNHSVEVVDLKTDKILQSINGLGKPHGLAYADGSLYVADGAKAALLVYKGSPLTLAATIQLSDDADDMAYDASGHTLYVGHGGSNAVNPAKVAVVDTAKLVLIANLAVATHPEALEMDPGGKRVFVNVADSNEVAVIDATAQKIVAHWKLTKAADNVPLAFDSLHQLLLIACRTPGTALALDAATGREVASLPAAGGIDDLFYDPALRRAYAISGQGEIDVYQVNEDRSLSAAGVVKTAAGAKTAVLDLAQNLLYVAVPGVTDEIRVYSPSAASAKAPAKDEASR